MVAKKVMLVLGFLLIAISCSMALPVFSAPTPSNNTPYGDYQLILNISDDSAMDWCAFEIDGVNQSGTLSDDFLSCWYELPQASKYVGHNYSVIGYDSVSAVEYATDLRNIPYYGCGYVNESVKLKTNVSFNGSWATCFQYIASSLTIDGNGYTVDGGSADMNRDLSKKRAKSVADYLVKTYNFDPNRFIIVGNGPDKPVATNSTEEGRAANRRTEFQLLGK